MPTWAWILLWLAVGVTTAYLLVWFTIVGVSLHIIRKVNKELDKSTDRITRWDDAMDRWEDR